LLTAVSGGCSGGRENVLAVRNCSCVAVCSAAQGASAPTGEERGGGIPWRPPAYNLVFIEYAGHYKNMYRAYSIQKFRCA